MGIPAVNIGTIPKRCGEFLLKPGVTVIVPESFLAQYGYDNQIQFDFTAYRDQMRTHTEDGRLSFDYWIPFSAVDGYGRHAIDIFKGFEALGADIALHDVGIGWVNGIWVDSHVQAAGMKGKSRLPSKVGLAMSLPYDPHIFNHQSAVKVVITQFETDHFPEKHAASVNMCDHLIVTSKFQPEMMRRSGVKIPISVLTPGVDTDLFAYKPRTPDGLFKCLMLGALTGRKNPLGALQMFFEASRGEPNWWLLIKTRKASGAAEIKTMLDKLGDHRVSMVIGDTPPQWVPGIYHDHDCLLWPSKGEGCGLPPLEAMACGLEVVCAHNSGMKDFIDDRWSWPIFNNGKESAQGPEKFSDEYVKAFGSVGNWWVPDLGEGAKQLRRAYEARADGNGKGQRAAEYVRGHHTLQHQAASVLSVIEKYS